MHRISSSSSGLPDIRPFLISGSVSGSKLPDSVPDSLMCCFVIFQTYSVSQY